MRGEKGRTENGCGKLHNEITTGNGRRGKRADGGKRGSRIAGGEERMEGKKEYEHNEGDGRKDRGDDGNERQKGGWTVG